MNKNKNRLLVLCFMKMLQERLERDKVEALSPVFGCILSKEELQDILKWLYLGKVPEQYDFNMMDKQDLLEAIGDDVHILSYSIERWNKELKEKITPQKVYDVLCQLQIETHYLMTKILADWDEYDHSNFKALCEKAGTEKPLYALFTSDTLEEDKYITPPFSKYHKTEWEAQEELAGFFSEGGIAENELKIMTL